MAESVQSAAITGGAGRRPSGAGQKNLMRPGNGTPWEDRGTLGVLPAFLKTCWYSLVRPGRLLDHIRRPETPHDAARFAWGCALLWFLSVLISSAITYVQLCKHPEQWDVNPFQFWVNTIVIALIAMFAVILLLKLNAGMYTRLGASELKGVPTVLTFNLFAYCLGPSLVALIPFIGLPLAAVWIFFNFFIAGRKRLYLNVASATVNVVLLLLVDLAIVAVGLFVLWLVWIKIMDNPGASPHIVPTVGQHVS